VSGIKLQQIVKSKYLYVGVVITGDGRRNKRLIHRLVKQMELCNLFRSVFTKRELSKIENLSVF